MKDSVTRGEVLRDYLSAQVLRCKANFLTSCIMGEEMARAFDAVFIAANSLLEARFNKNEARGDPKAAQRAFDDSVVKLGLMKGSGKAESIRYATAIKIIANSDAQVSMETALNQAMQGFAGEKPVVSRLM